MPSHLICVLSVTSPVTVPPSSSVIVNLPVVASNAEIVPASRISKWL